MKIKIILLLTLVLLASCNNSGDDEKEAQNKVKISVQKRRIAEKSEEERLRKEEEEKFKREEDERKERELEEARINPLKKYISDEIYEDGREIFYGKEQYMFTINKSEFSEKIQTLESEIKSKFEIKMLMTHKGTTSAILTYNSEGKSMRAIVNGSKTLVIDEENYYLRAFKDKVQIKKGENPLVISLYSRER